jgi:hypothetical protein
MGLSPQQRSEAENLTQSSTLGGGGRSLSGAIGSVSEPAIRRLAALIVSLDDSIRSLEQQLQALEKH